MFLSGRPSLSRCSVSSVSSLAQVLAGRHEDARWRREVERDDTRWDRERRREMENRAHTDRAASYAQVIGAIEALDWSLYRARKMRATGADLDQYLADELRATVAAAGGCLGAVNLHAPERVRSILRDSMKPRSRLTEKLLSESDCEEPDVLWFEGKRAYQRMRSAMRARPRPRRGAGHDRTVTRVTVLASTGKWRNPGR